MIRFKKKLLFFVLLVIVTNGAIAGTGLSLITGSIDKQINGSVALFKINHGELTNTAVYQMDGSGMAFSFAIAANEDALYYIILNAGIKKDGKLQTIRIANTPVFVKQCEHVNVKFITANQQALVIKDCLITQPSPENIALLNWMKKSEPVVKPWMIQQTQVSFPTYYSRYQQLLPQLTTYAKQLQCPGNPSFSRTLHALAEAQLKFSPLLMYYSQKEWQATENVTAMKPMLENGFKKLQSFCNAEVLNSGISNEMMKLYDISYSQAKKAMVATTDAGTKINQIKEVVNIICNDTLKGNYITGKMAGIYKINASDFEAQMASLKPYLVTSYMQAAYNQKLQELSGKKADDKQERIASAPLSTSIGVTTENISVIQGVLSNFGIAGEVSLLRVENGTGKEICHQRLARNDANFTLAAIIDKPAFYYLQCGNISFRMYLQPKDQLSVKLFTQANSVIGKTQYSYEVIDGSRENKLLQQWFTLSLPVTVHGLANRIVGNDTTSQSTYTNAYELVHAQVKGFLQNIPESNTAFSKLIQQAVKVDMEYGPLLFLAYQTDKVRYLQPNTFHGYNVVPVFYKRFIDPSKFYSTDVLQCKEGADYINFYSKLSMALYEKESQRKLAENEELKWMLDGICNDSIKSFVIAQQLDEVEITNLSQFNNYFLPIKSYVVQEDVKRKYNEVYAQFANDTMFLGKPAFDISLPDTSGKIINLNSYKGKVIFIDTWATWCGLCKEQLPFLKELEEAYKNEQGIVFAGISIDRSKDIPKWKSMIKTQQLPGLQLLDEGGKKFRYPMHIEAIPRFLLIDKKGNWIEVRCPKPDEKQRIHQYIDRALQAQ